MPAPQREGAICTGLKEILQTYLATYIAEINPLIIAPDNDNGYTMDNTVPPRDKYNFFAIFTDASNHIKYESCGHKKEFIKFGIEWTFQDRLHLLGDHKRDRGVILRRCIEEHQKGNELAPHGVYRITTQVDYRYPSHRQAGGARRGLQGESQNTGNCIDAIVLGVNCWIHTLINIDYND